MNIQMYKRLFMLATIISIYTIIYGFFFSPFFSSEVKYIVVILMIFGILFNGYNFYWNRYKGNWKYFLITIFFMMSGVSIFMALEYPGSYRALISLFFIFNAMAMFVGASLLFDTIKTPPPVDFFEKYTNK